MTDFQPVQESELQTGGPEPEGLTGDGVGGLSKNTYQPVNEDELAPPAGAINPAFRGFRGGVPNIPAAAAARFYASDSLRNIFTNAATRAAQGFSNTFNDLTAQDAKLLADNRYFDYNGPGGLLQHAADAFNSGAALLKDGFFATGSAISGAFGGAFEQFARETGQNEDRAESARSEGELTGDFAQLMAGTPEAAAIGAARATLAEPGVWGQVFRADRTEGGGMAMTPLGRFPDAGAEADAQAAAAADALHLPPSAAKTIGDTYKQTGRSPAEVYLDAKTNNGGVLSDIVAGKVPSVYQGPARAMTPEEIEAAKTAVSPEGGAARADLTNPQIPAANDTALSPPSAPTPEATGISKIGKSIEAKAVEDGLTEGFGNTAGYDKITIADQAQRTANLINTDLDKARAVIRGDEPLPSGMKGTALITAMEDYIKKNPDPDLAYELANSPLVTGTSEAAQEMRLAAERTPDSAAAKLAEIKAANEQAAGGRAKVAQNVAAAKAAAKEASNGVFLPKEALRWDKFLDEIRCP